MWVSITWTISFAQSSWSSANMVNMLIRGLLLHVRSAKEDLYSSMASADAIFATQMTISGLTLLQPFLPSFRIHQIWRSGVVQTRDRIPSRKHLIGQTAI